MIGKICSVGEENSREVLPFGGKACLGSLEVGYRVDVFILGIGLSKKDYSALVSEMVKA